MTITPEALEELAGAFKTKTAEMANLECGLRKMHDDLKQQVAANDGVSVELKASIDKALTNFNTLGLSVKEIEQRMTQRVETKEGEKSWGEQFVNSDAYKNATDRNNRKSSISCSVKQVTSAAAGGLIRSYRELDITSLGKERRVMRDILSSVPIGTSSVDYPTQTVRTNNAAPVAEAASKAYSDYEWGSATAVVRTIAHLAKITRQAMDDAPRLMGEIDLEMRYGLGYVEERQLLYGDGTGQNLSGIVPQATTFASPGGTTVLLPSRIDVLRLAMLQVSIGLFPSDAIVLNQIDWAAIELTKSSTGEYLLANPQGGVLPNMWGLPVVVTPAMVAGDFLTGAFRIGATIYDRMQVEVLVSTENDKDFEKNLATIRAEERLALAVKRPGSFVTGTFSTAITAITD